MVATGPQVSSGSRVEADMRLLSRLLPPALAALALLAAPAAHATPVAENDAQYATFGRVFPDPMGGCQRAGTSPCSPNAQGAIPAQQFIGVDEFVRGIQFLNSRSEWQRYLEVWPLDGTRGENADGVPAGTNELEAFPGNNLGRFEFTPRAEYRSAGIPTTGNDRTKSDVYVLRVTDERVPDARKKRYAVSLSIHGIERAGVEGGTRAVEDLVTAFTTKRDAQRIVPDGTIAGAPTFADVLEHAIIYFTYPNPDGWRRGSVSAGGIAFQRYNGNGVDMNRDWPDVGFAFRPYSPLSEPETRALAGFFSDAKGGGAKFDAGVDLHGQLTADALSYTLIGHGKHDYAKDLRLREGAKAIHRVSEKALAWSPMIVPNNTPKSQNGCTGSDTGIEACARIYGQTWGTVYDTINYTTTGTLGDWMDSPVGLDADGLDNEMSFSHLDRNIVFDPHGEQLHVDGNKALLYAQITQLLRPPGAAFQTGGRKGYVPNARLERAEQSNTVDPPPGTVAQAKIDDQMANDAGPGQVLFDFPVKLGPQPADGSPDAGKDVFNGGLRVEITKLNAAGISDGNAVTTLKVQCRGCDDHPGIDPDTDGFITVAEDFNQSPGYAQGGLTAAVNRPLAKNREGKKVEWRALLESAGGLPNLLDAGAAMDVIFSQGPATSSGDTGGAAGPRLRAYDVANTDFLDELNRHVPRGTRGFEALDPRRIARGTQSLDGFTSIVLADDPLPGYAGPYGGGAAGPSTGDYTVAEKDAYFAALKKWVRGGGNLVLTDGALRALPELSGLPATAVGSRKLYVGQVAFKRSATESTVKEPLVGSPNAIAEDGARFNSDDRRQTYEPVPLGFAIQHTKTTDQANVGDDDAQSPAWDVDAAAFKTAGGRVVASAVEAGPSGSKPVYGRAAMGELGLGTGQIRMLGALAPQPSTAFDHDFGLEPYAMTYTGWLLFCNMLGADCAARPTASQIGGVAGATACPARNGFRSASARPRGRRVRLRVAHRSGRPVRVDVFQVSHRRRVLGQRLVARFDGRARGFTWNGRANHAGKRVTDGFYFVRLRTRTGAQGELTDTRRFALRRTDGRFTLRPSFHRRTSCGTLQAFKLVRPVFGGRGDGPLRINYRLRRRAGVQVQVRRDGRVLKTFKARVRRANRTFRLAFPARAAAARGDYRVRIRVRRGTARTVATLTARRL
jgi:hypothetical protein